MIYLDWEEDIKMMDPKEAQNFILNIIRDAKGEQPYLPSRVEQMHWLQIKRILDINKDKYEKQAQRSRENGMKGGRKKNPQNPTGFFETQENPENLINHKS